MSEKYNSVVVLGPTASGKTALACRIASKFSGEIISADSRQVYRKLNLGTGKDLHEYTVEGKQIPFHLIDIAEPAEQFFLHQFQELLLSTFDEIINRNKLPVICGGTGLYLDALRKDYSLTQVPEDAELRKTVRSLDKESLIFMLNSFNAEHISKVDKTSVKRIVRGIEIARYLQKQTLPDLSGNLPYRPYYIGISTTKEERTQRIGARLDARLKGGLVEEVRELVDGGLSHERLQYLGLEYRFVSEHLQGKLSFEEMRSKLKTAICQYAKRQMTWFRKMEKEGVQITWIKWPAETEYLHERLTHLFTAGSDHHAPGSS